MSKLSGKQIAVLFDGMFHDIEQRAEKLSHVYRQLVRQSPLDSILLGEISGVLMSLHEAMEGLHDAAFIAEDTGK